jgi:hypothetical protein
MGPKVVAKAERLNSKKRSIVRIMNAGGEGGNERRKKGRRSSP